MQGQLDVLKSIPLNSIDISLRELAKTNSMILSTLKDSATTLVKDTKEAKSAVRHVKEDLAKG
jgi:hypothetical protein